MSRRAHTPDAAESGDDTNAPKDANEAGVRRALQAGLAGEQVSAKGVLDAIGGWRGVIESLLPASVFLVIFVLTRDAILAALMPVGLAVLMIAWRAIKRQPLQGAFSGLLGVVVCAVAVLFTGEGSSYFVPGFFINGAWILAHTVSLLIGWPLIGLLLGGLRGSFTEWRKIPALKRAANITTVLWIVMFSARLLVQLPLYFAAESGGDATATDALGIARLVMGVPLFALAILFTWQILARVSAKVDASAQSSSDE